MVDGHPPQLMQVFLNLVLNALHAMEGVGGDEEGAAAAGRGRPGGGTIRVEADVVRRADYQSVDLPPHSGDRLVRVRVRDSGPGIPREIISKVFDPFFTTKPVGKGSGLGLSVSLGLVQGYRGTILVDSDGESWTEFTVLLPVTDDDRTEGRS
jgi:signal transduction histidine kinase